MDSADFHAILMRRLQHLHQVFMEASAGMSERQFERLGSCCSHANWLVGHHLWEKDVLLAEWPTGKSLRPGGIDELYGFGSTPAEAGACPGIDELRGTIEDLHEPMLARLTPDSLVRACVAAPAVFPTPLDSALHFIHDASYHLGQLNYIRKLGAGVERSRS